MAAMKRHDRRIRRHVVMAAGGLSLALFVFSVFVSPGSMHAADRPASPAQLQAMQDQIAGLQAQLRAQEAELRTWEGQIADIKVKMLGLGALQDIGGNAGGSWTFGENLGMTGGQAALQYQLIAAQTKRDLAAQQIPGLQQQIAQLQASLNYWRNPLGTDLENERAGLRNLESQQPTKDDGGQLQWDIDNRRRRIKELEEEFQRQQQGGGATSQSAQPQGQSYTTPTQGYGTGGPAGQSPPMGPYLGGHEVTPPRRPWDTLVDPSGGEGGHLHPGGGSSGSG